VGPFLVGRGSRKTEPCNEAADINEFQPCARSIRVPSRGSTGSLPSWFCQQIVADIGGNDALHIDHNIDHGSARELAESYPVPDAASSFVTSIRSSGSLALPKMSPLVAPKTGY
jgi:hypothetical protein